MTRPPDPVASTWAALESDLRFLVVTEPGRARLRMLINAYAREKALAAVDEVSTWAFENRGDLDARLSEHMAALRARLAGPQEKKDDTTPD